MASEEEEQRDETRREEKRSEGFKVTQQRWLGRTINCIRTGLRVDDIAT